MKKILLFLALVSVVATGVSQNVVKSGIYDKHGKAILVNEDPLVVSVTLRVATEKFTPGVYARYAQKYLGQRATLSEYSTIEILDGRLAYGACAKLQQPMEIDPESSPLPVNKLSSASQSAEEQAAATAEMIFSLRKHRLELITGEAGENVFGAGLKAALDEIARLENECLQMFYGSKTIEEKSYSFNVTITPDKRDYLVCRFSDRVGVVEVNNLAGKPIVVKVESEKGREYAKLSPVEIKDKNTAEYTVIPQVKCSLVSEAMLMDTLTFVSPLFAETVLSTRIK